MTQTIHIRGARTHNLQGLDLEQPAEQPAGARLDERRPVQLQAAAELPVPVSQGGSWNPGQLPANWGQGLGNVTPAYNLMDPKWGGVVRTMGTKAKSKHTGTW